MIEESASLSFSMVYGALGPVSAWKSTTYIKKEKK
jgi:hypothetical protein